MGCNCSTQIKDKFSIGYSHNFTESTLDDEPDHSIIDYDGSLYGIIDYIGNLSYIHDFIPTEKARVIHHIADEFKDHFGKSKSPNVNIRCKSVYFLKVDDFMERKELHFKYKIGNERIGSSLAVFDNILIDLASGVNEITGKLK